MFVNQRNADAGTKPRYMDCHDAELMTRMVLEALEMRAARPGVGDTGNMSSPGVRISGSILAPGVEDAGGMLAPVGVSARHVHLSREHARALFGENYALTKKQNLMGGQFAANETVVIVGLKLRAIENVRVIGPERGRTQVEISATDAVRLGVTAPLRDSGDVGGSAPVAIVGPKGAVFLEEGCIIAARHLHMQPGDAAAAGLHDGDAISVNVGGERGLTLDRVKIRVDESYTLEMHIDTDEANACNIRTGDCVRVRGARRTLL